VETALLAHGNSVQSSWNNRNQRLLIRVLPDCRDEIPIFVAAYASFTAAISIYPVAAEVRQRQFGFSDC
jgi:hypothetical protein